ncbi:DNA translocase FtsK, partial [bacterium]
MTSTPPSIGRRVDILARKVGPLFNKNERKPEPEDPLEDEVPAIPVAVTPPANTAKKVDGQTIFTLPPLTLLKAPEPILTQEEDNAEEKRDTLLQTLEDFGIGANITEVAQGPVITRYEVALERGIKVSKIVSLADNLAMSLAAMDVRIEAPIPGKSAIGIEVPNTVRQAVTLREVIERPEFKNAPGKLTFALGKDVTGVCRYADLAKMPHLLIGGSTGSGKSVGLNTLICSLLYRCTPRELKLLMIDPKKVELSLYEGIPHLAAPVIT